MRAKVIVVGAGVIGGATALALAEQGFKVNVIDRSNQVASEASSANGAQLSYSFTDTLASVETLKLLPKLLLEKIPAFRLSSGVDFGLFRWGMQFLRNCSASKADSNTVAVLNLALQSCCVMNKWRAKYGFSFDHKASQKLQIFESHETLEKLKPRIALKNRFGAKQSLLSKEELLELEPSLKWANAELAGAVYSPGDEVGDAAIFTRLSIQKAIELGGGELFLNTEFRHFITNSGRFIGVQTSNGEMGADFIVLCCGYRSAVLARQLLGHWVPIIPMAGYALTYPAVSQTPKVSVTDTPNRMVLCRLGDKLRVAGMADIGRISDIPPHDRIHTLQSILKKRFPKAGDYDSPGDPQIGIRPMSPSGRPFIYRYKSSNLYFNCGHGMLGWTLAAGSAQRLKELLINNLP